MNLSFTMIGGDTRSIYLKQLLEKDGHLVHAYALSDTASVIPTTLDTPYILGPVPFSKNNTHLFAPHTTQLLEIKSLFEKMTPTQTLFYGGTNKTLLSLIEQYSINAIDLLAKKSVAILNAIPTAEGALKLAIEQTSTTIHQSHCLVIGYGNIGKILARHLLALGATVSVACRKAEDLATVTANNFIKVPFHQLEEALPKADVIFNTVPYRSINENNIHLIDPDALWIELASSPFGIDFELAKLFPFQFVNGQSLPGKVAPKSAALYLKNSLYEELELLS